MGLLAKKIRLGEYLFIGRGEEASGGRQKPANLARGLEAILGAIYLDGGIDKTKIVGSSSMAPNCVISVQPCLC
jgi:ribonuclease-3